MDKNVFFKKASDSRIHTYDTLRGIMIVLMIIFHSAFDIYEVFGKDFGFLHIINTPFILFLRDFFAVGFIVLSGICTNYSRNPLRRGIIVFAFGLLVTFATAIVMPELTIRFGILSLIGTSMILAALLRPFHDTVGEIWGMAVAGVAFAVTVFIFPVHTTVNHLYFLGFVTTSFSSGDFYPLVPYYFAFLFGHFLGRMLKERKLDRKIGGFNLKPFSFVGRNSVYFYLAHQPLVYVICWILFVKMGL